MAAVVSSEADLQLLVSQVRRLEDRKKASDLLAGAAEVVDTLGSLIPRLYNPTSSLCSTSTEATFQELRELASMISDTAALPSAQFGRKALRQAGRTLYAIVAFLRNLRQTFDGLSNSCNSDMGKDYTLAISATFDDLADLMGVLGSYTDAEKIRKGAVYIRKVVNEFAPLDGLDLWDRPAGVECSSASLEGAAALMRELALALEDEGVMQISQELGIKLDFLEVDF